MTSPEVKYDVHVYFWQFVDHWQTLIAGVFAVLAAIATIYFTVKAASREVAVAQAQITENRKAERHSLARENYAFMTVLAASMALVIDECDQALQMNDTDPEPSAWSQGASTARKHLTKTGFEDLRSALIRIGADLAVPFLQIDRDITAFAARTRSNTRGHLGERYHLRDEIAVIVAQASHLQDEAALAMARCLKVIEETTRAP